MLARVVWCCGSRVYTATLLSLGTFLASPLTNKQTNKQTNKTNNQTNKQTHHSDPGPPSRLSLAVNSAIKEKQTNKQTVRQTIKQTNKKIYRSDPGPPSRLSLALSLYLAANSAILSSSCLFNLA